MFVHILPVVARVPSPPIISAWRIGIMPGTMSVIISPIIPVWIIRFIIRVGRSNPHAMKSTTIINPNGAPAEDNQESY